MWDVQIEQTLPRWGERDASLSLAAADALAADAEFRMQLGDLAGDMAMDLADGEAARATGLLLDAQIARTSAVDQALVTRIATGSAAMADRLALMTQLTDLRLERERLTAAFTNSDADVRGRLGLAANELLPAFAAPDPTVIVIEQTPQVVAARARMSQAEARQGEARSQGHPMTAIGLRFERESPDMGNEDTLGLEMRVSLPVYQGSIAAGVEAAHAQRRAAAQDALTAQYRAQTMLARVARATAVAQRAREAAEVNRSRLDAAYQALAGAAGAQGEVGVTAILALLDRMTSTERQVIDADAACRAAQADLWRLAPPLPDSIP